VPHAELPVSGGAEGLMAASGSDAAGAEMILVIRHGEKPEGAAKGVTLDGVESAHSLVPRGWQRAGGLVGLLASQNGTLRAGLAQPELIIVPAYPQSAGDRRTHQTVQPLGEKLQIGIADQFEEEHERELGSFVSEQSTARVVLICWEHKRIPAIAAGVSAVSNPQDIPTEWPPERFDLIWRFVREPGGYSFSVLPQLLLPNDSDPPNKKGGS
jgi:hypothetical protein